MTIARTLSAALLTMGCGAAPWGDAPPGWIVAEVPGRRATEFATSPDGAVTIRADRSVAFLVREAPEAPALDPRLTWRWRVDRSPPPVAPDAEGQDDRPAAVHVIFAGTDDGVGPLTSFRRWLRGTMVHGAFTGRSLTYMWGGTLPAGTRLPNPYLPGDGWVIVQRGPETPNGAWRTETIDPAADYRALFGSPAPRLTYLALSADTEDSGGCAVSRIEPPRFVPMTGGPR